MSVENAGQKGGKKRERRKENGARGKETLAGTTTDVVQLQKLVN